MVSYLTNLLLISTGSHTILYSINSGLISIRYLIGQRTLLYSINPGLMSIRYSLNQKLKSIYDFNFICLPILLPALYCAIFEFLIASFHAMIVLAYYLISNVSNYCDICSIIED